MDSSSLEPSDHPVIEWPERPTCHDDDWSAQRFAPQTWRPAGVRLHPENDHVPAFRTCSYCGSIHPEDLLNALRAGAKAGGSDWKYGWPHKFYIEGIPNSQAGNLVTRMSGSGPLPMTERDRAEWESHGKRPGCKVEITEDGDRWRARVLEPDGATTHGKWYNVHLKDLSQAAFDELAPLLERHTGIKFERDEKGIKYSAPRHGYQA
jgi:hypothetical protein